MSVTFSYFFNSDKSFDQLRSEINGWLGCNLAPYAGDQTNLFDCFLGMEFSFSGEEGYENDREIDFENFKYEIGIRIPAPDGDIHELAIAAMMLVILVLYRRVKISDGIFVHDVQRLLGRYEERKRPEGYLDLYDVVMEDFVTIPGHLNDLYLKVY